MIPQIQYCPCCNEPILGSYAIDIWGTIVHANHHLNTCYACGRFILEDTKYLADGRTICSSCLDSIVSKPSQIKWVDERVRAMLYDNGIDNLPLSVPIRIVNSTTMSKKFQNAEIGEKALHLGLTLCEEIVLYNKRVCKQKILLLDHQPKILFAGSLAHELLHVWQNQYNIKLRSELSEGFSNLGSYLMYKSINNKISDILIKQMFLNTDPNYGVGFKKVKSIMDAIGKADLKIVMNRLLTLE